MEININGREPLQIENLLLDFNGTIAQGGRISSNVKSLLELLSKKLNIFVVTADTRGNAAAECSGTCVKLLEMPGGISEDNAKLEVLESLGKDKTVALGNGRNDASMLAQAALGICVLGEEGAHKAAVAAAQILVNSIENGLKLVSEPDMLNATLRN